MKDKALEALGDAKAIDERDTYIAILSVVKTKSEVAILSNNAVGSSGEAIAVSFVKRSTTKSFGSSTCGVATSNSQFDFSSVSILNLTIAYFADREKNLFGVDVRPDSVVSNENLVNAAVQ